MIRTAQRATMRQHLSSALALALTCGLLASMTRADVLIEGTPAAVRVTTGQDTIADVLSVIGATFDVKYRTEIPLDAAAHRTYSGSLGHVISRLLDGYSYVIKNEQEETEIFIFAKRGETAISPGEALPPPKAPPAKGILSQWR